MQEKFRQAGENLDDLNRWLDTVEREIASQDIPQENVDSLKTQIKSLKVCWHNENYFIYIALQFSTKLCWLVLVDKLHLVD